MEDGFADHILVPTDFGPEADIAFRRGCDLARTMSGRLTLLHVRPRESESASRPSRTGLDAIGLLHDALTDPALPGEIATRARRHAEKDPAHQKLARIATSEWAMDVAVNADVRNGDVATEILRFAADRGVGLIVMGARSGATSPAGPAQSVVVRVLRESSCPVMFVPRKLRRTPLWAGLRRMFR